MGEVIPFPRREPQTVHLRRIPIAKSGLRTKAEVLYGTEMQEWVVVDAIVPRDWAAAVIAAIHAVAD